MTSGPDGTDTTTCRACRAVVPAAVFCGRCGFTLDSEPDYWRMMLRPRQFAVAPRETITLPLVISSLFPHLTRSARNPFRLGLLLLVVGLIVFAVLRSPGPLVTLAGLGVPLLFVLYLWQSGVARDMPRHEFAIAGGVGVALGVGWVLLTGGLVARAYGIPMAAGFVLEHVVNVGLLLSVGGAVMMALPAVVVRLLGPDTRESLDGFVIGALGALSFTAAATVTRLAPQFISGLFDKARSLRMFVEAVLYGLAVPLTAAAAGGLIGVVLWFHPGERAGRHPGRVRTSMVLFSGLVVAIYIGVWLVDAARLPRIQEMLLHLEMTVPALLALRTGMQMALLHEEPDPFTGLPWLCVHCERVVPEMPFCPACGAAARASSRTSRRLRRESRPVRDPALT